MLVPSILHSQKTPGKDIHLLELLRLSDQVSSFANFEPSLLMRLSTVSVATLDR